MGMLAILSQVSASIWDFLSSSMSVHHGTPENTQTSHFDSIIKTQISLLDENCQNSLFRPIMVKMGMLAILSQVSAPISDFLSSAMSVHHATLENIQTSHFDCIIQTQISILDENCQNSLLRLLG